MAEMLRRCALEDARPLGSGPGMSGGGVHVEALPLLGHVLIQLPPGNADGRRQAALELTLPAAPNHAVGIDPAILWLGPRAWVAITGDVDAAGALAARIATQMRAAGGHAVELSDAHQSLRITGPGASTLLAQGCALDFDGASFGAGRATRTAIARMPAILHRTAAEAFLLHVDRSLASALWDWLDRGVREMAALADISRAPVS
jgi:heterotetrameric sarcosine oxidase gamma subunit